MVTVPSELHKTVKVADVPEAAETEIAEQEAVPLACTKSVYWIPVTAELNVTGKVNVLDEEVVDGVVTVAVGAMEFIVTTFEETGLTGPVFWPSVTVFALIRS